jgi:dienelactone hydrolase
MATHWYIALATVVSLSQTSRPPVYSIDVWKEIVGPERYAAAPPRHVYAQPGRLGPLLELQTDRGLVPVTTKRQWRQKRGHLRQNFTWLFGRFPQRRAPLDLKVTAEEDVGRYIRKTIEFNAEPGDRDYGFLLVPKGITGKVPGIVCPHQTNEVGCLEPIGLGGDPQYAYADELAQRGYVTIACDALCFGKRHAADANYYGDSVSFYEKHPDWTIAGKYAFDVSRQVDVLQSLPEVDPERIGCIGHSLGGHTTIYAMTYDPRIKVGVSNCGFTSFRADQAARGLWAYYNATSLFPILYQFDSEEAVARLPLDYHEMLALVAPRPFLIIAPTRDPGFAHEGVVDTFEALKPLYAFLGVPDDIQMLSPDCEHAFPAEIREKAYAFLEEHLNAR